MSETDHSYLSEIAVLRSIKVGDIRIRKRQISGDITITRHDGTEDTFRLIFSYSEDIEADTNIAGLMLTMPVINFTYFSENLVLEYPISSNDRSLIEEFLKINAKEVFINKICRRRYEFFLEKYLPSDDEINQRNAEGSTTLIAPFETSDARKDGKIPEKSLVLSSGGKESLLTYGMLREIGIDTRAFFFNESGGHWRTAKTSYEYFQTHFKQVSKVWSNVDRFYTFMNSRLGVLNMKTVRKRADTYPVRLFIFPVYVFASIPLVMQHGIGNILMGNEFDDPKDMPPYKGIKHYFGVFDQSKDFLDMMTGYFSRKGIPARLWSAVYPISGIAVEDILVNRYRELFMQQRSCHSCRVEGGSIKPCGECTKCLGVMMFILAAGGNPGDVLYGEKLVRNLEENVSRSRMRLDPDELGYLRNRLWGYPSDRNLSHVKGLHILPGEKELMQQIPEGMRAGILEIYRRYCEGTYSLANQEWNQDLR